MATEAKRASENTTTKLGSERQMRGHRAFLAVLKALAGTEEQSPLENEVAAIEAQEPSKKEKGFNIREKYKTSKKSSGSSQSQSVELGKGEKGSNVISTEDRFSSRDER